MNTLDLREAADLCKKSTETMKRWARDRTGEIGRLAVKSGKDWIWIRDDLIDALRAQYTAPPCPSTSRRTPRSGTSISAYPATPDYVNQLDSLIAARRKKSTMN